MSEQTPPSPPPSEPELTAEEIATIAQTLLPATARRIKVLTQSLIQQTASADYWLWAPLAGMEMVFQEMHWDREKKNLAAERLLCLSVVLLRRMSDRFADYLHRLEDARAQGQPAPPPFDWTAADTEDVYDLVSAMYPDDQAPRDNERTAAALVMMRDEHGVTAEGAADYVASLNDAASLQLERWACAAAVRKMPDGDVLPVVPRPSWLPPPAAPETVHTSREAAGE